MQIARLATPAVTLALLLVPSPGAAQGPPAGDRAARVDQIFSRWGSLQSPGCAVGVGRDGEVVVSRAYGSADLEHDVPNTPETVFEAGSVSKQLTAAAVVLLAQQGKLSLDDDVRKHVPELPVYEAPITIRHLLNHTSGLRDWGTVLAAAGWPRTTRIHSHHHVLDVISRQRALNYTPGAEYSYTNSGYNLLAIIAERVSGESLDAFSRKHIFQPLGMTRTQWRDDFTEVVEDRSTAYRPAPDGGFRLLMPFENVYGNGGLLTTAGDLLRWTENLEHGRVGGRALIEEMHRQARLNDGRQLTYASGLVVDRYRGLPEVSHSGSTAGYRAFLTRFPEQRLSVAVLCNAGDAGATSLARQAADLFLPASAPMREDPPAVRIPAQRLAARAGLYRSRRTGEPLRLNVAGERLRMEGRVELIPTSDSTFAVRGRDERLVFSLDAAGRPTAMRIVAGDGDVVAFEPVAEADPTPAQLRAYEGEYRSDEAEATYSVVTNGARLELRRRPGVVIPLTPAYADAFVTDEGWLVRFRRGASGGVEEMSFGMGRVRDLRFSRVSR